MYSYEMEQYIRDRHYQLTPQECAYLMNIERSNQIVNIKYYPADNSYLIDTMDGYRFTFIIRERKTHQL